MTAVTRALSIENRISVAATEALPLEVRKPVWPAEGVPEELLSLVGKYKKALAARSGFKIAVLEKPEGSIDPKRPGQENGLRINVLDEDGHKEWERRKFKAVPSEEYRVLADRQIHTPASNHGQVLESSEAVSLLRQDFQEALKLPGKLERDLHQALIGVHVAEENAGHNLFAGQQDHLSINGAFEDNDLVVVSAGVKTKKGELREVFLAVFKAASSVEHSSISKMIHQEMPVTPNGRSPHSGIGVYPQGSYDAGGVDYFKAAQLFLSGRSSYYNPRF